MGKGNEDLKAKIAKIQSKGKTAPVPAEIPEVAEEVSDDASEDQDDMNALNARFEAEKKAIQERAKKKAPKAPVAPQEPEEEVVEEEQAGIEEAINEYSDDGKFRVELIFQAVQLNASLKGIDASLKQIAETLKGLVATDE